MVRLTDDLVIKMLREEWNRKVSKLTEDVENNIGSTEVISPGLKVMHKKSRYRYTVDSVGKDDVVLLTPEGEKFLVDAETLEKGYILS